jgi:hypothetical protein
VIWPLAAFAVLVAGAVLSTEVPVAQLRGADGSRSPQSRDLSLELADLVDDFPIMLEVHRAVVSRPDWDTAPHRVRVRRGLAPIAARTLRTSTAGSAPLRPRSGNSPTKTTFVVPVQGAGP